jgi:hypothetical protein
MANFCSTCGIPLPINSDTQYCSQHGGPPLSPESQIRCPFCKETILAEAKKCRFCGEFLTKPVAVVPVRATAAPQQFPIGSVYCTSCGHIGPPRGMNKAELIFVLIVSLFTLFVPLIIYLIVRSGDRCRNCGKKTVVPVSSPVARTVIASLGSRGSTQTAAPSPNLHQLVSVAERQPKARQSKKSQGFVSGVLDWMGQHPAWTILITVLVLGWMAHLLVNQANGPAMRDDSSATERQQQEQEAAERFKSMSPSEHFAAATALLKTGAPKADIAEALRHLELVPVGSKEYRAATVVRKAAAKRLARIEQQERAEDMQNEIRAHPQDSLAGIVCEDYVKGQLKAPATADFQSFLGRSVIDEGNWRYQVSSYVDSQNDFGANIRTYFTCDVQCVADGQCTVIGFSSSP